MGVCCSSIADSEHIIQKYLSLMKIRRIDYIHLKNIILNEENSLELTNEFKMKLSEKTLHLFQESLKQISKENFMNIVEEKFLFEDENEYKAYQRVYFEEIFELSKNSKTALLFYLFSLLKVTKNSGSFFSELLSQIVRENSIVTFSAIRNNLFFYVKSNLVNPMFILLNKTDDDKLKEELNYKLLNIYDNGNISRFVQYILEEFDREMLIHHDDSEDYSKQLLSHSDLNKIFNGKVEYLFNINELRLIYLKFINSSNS